MQLINNWIRIEKPERHEINFKVVFYGYLSVQLGQINQDFLIIRLSLDFLDLMVKIRFI